MEKDNVLLDVGAALMLSFAIIVTMFHVVNRFMTPLYSAILIIAGLITAIVFLFVCEDSRRTMRIISICCNSIAIGSIFGLLFMLLEMSINIIPSVIMAAIFAGIIFVLYYLFYMFDTRVLPGIIGFLLIGVGGALYWVYLLPMLSDEFNIFIIMFGVITIIHYIIALIVVTSDKKTIIDGMSYGYFGITLAILVVAGIFLLMASDGDLDIDIGGGSSSGSSKSSKSSPSRSSGKVKSTTSRVFDTAVDLGDAYVYTGTDTVTTKQTLIHQRYMLQDAFYIAYLGVALNDLTLEQIDELNVLEKQYLNGVYTVDQYKKKLDKYKVK